MDKIDEFFEPAKKISLSQEELLACRERLIQEMQGKPVRAANIGCHTGYMTDFDPSLVSAAHTVRLSAEESDRATKALQAFMKVHPVNMAAAIQKHEQQMQKTGWLSFFSFRSAPALAAIMLLVLGGGSLSYAAESALPGDALYPVKIHVNEQVHAALALSTEAKAEWETARAERRIQEAKQLATHGRLTPEKTTVLVSAFNAHIAKAHTGIQAIADRGDRDRAGRIGQKAERILREQVSALGLNENVAVVLQHVQRAADNTIALDTSIHGTIALTSQTASTDGNIQMNAKTNISVVSDSRASSRALIAIDSQTERKEEKKNNGVNTDKEHNSDMPPPAFQETGLLNMQHIGSGSSVSSKGSGSSALSARSKPGTPVKIDIKSDGTIDVKIDTSEKKNTIKW